jgi:hypothetical protein
MKKSTEIVSRIITDQIIFETKSGSIQLSTDPQGRMHVGKYARNEQNQIIIDPIQGRITATSLVVNGTISAQEYEGLSGIVSNEAIDSLDTKISTIDFSLDSRLSTEISSRFSTGLSLDGRISTTDFSLGNRISLETANRFSTETSLTGRISLETSIRSVSETSLTGRLSISEVSLASGISLESSFRSSLETSVNSKISLSETSLTGRLSTSEISLSGRISTETSLRSTSETSLVGRISTETSLRSTSETSLVGRISTETSIRSSSETSLVGRLSTSEVSLTGRLSTSETSLAGRISVETSLRSSTETSLTGRISLSENVGNSANSLSTLIEGRFTSGLLNTTNAAAELRNTNISLAQASDGQITLTRGGSISPIAINPLTTTTFTSVQTTANNANSIANNANSTANTINQRFETNGKLKSANLSDDANGFKFTSSRKFKIGIGQAQTTTSGGGLSPYDSDTDIEIVTGSSGTPDFGFLKAQAQGNLILGQINFKGWNGSQFTNGLGVITNGANYSERATIQCITNGLGGGRLEFYTAEESSYNTFIGTPTTPIKRMTIADDGFVGIGTNTPAHRLDINADLGTNYACRLRNSNSSGNGIIVGSGGTGTTTLIQFRNNSNTIVGSITQNGTAVSYGAFTGEHPGLIVELDKDYTYGCVVKIDSINNVGRNIFYTVSKTSSSYDKRVMGIFAGIESLNLESDSNFSGSYSIYSLGDGHIMVCNEGGDIQIGDYLCSSNTPGVAMKQNDDLLHSYTVAKASENVSWNEQTTGSVLISCTYHSA